MWLLYFDSSKRLTSADFNRETVPPYAILSRTWGDDKFLFEDLMNGTGESKACLNTYNRCTAAPGYMGNIFSKEQMVYLRLDASRTPSCSIHRLHFLRATAHWEQRLP
jgi:hypothetical protein